MISVKAKIVIASLAVLLSLLVNVLLFSFQPLISGIRPAGPDLDRLIPVKITRLPQEQQRPPVRESRVDEEVQAVMSEELTPLPVLRDLDLSLPAMRLSINPLLVTGIPISLPEKAAPTLEITTRTFTLAEVDQPPAPLFQLKPEYPYGAKRSNLTGKVSVMFLVDKSGKVIEVDILKADPEGVFEQSVRAALAKWKFLPGKLKGEKVATWVSTTIRFELD